MTVTCTEFEWRRGRETLRVFPCGPDAFRVVAAVHPEGLSRPLPSALLDDRMPGSPPPVTGPARATNGALAVELDAAGRLRFTRTGSDEPLVEELAPVLDSARAFKALGDAQEVVATFRAWDGERLYGLGQHPHGRLDQKGCVLALEQRNTQVAIPFLLSSRGYGFLWNLPAVGRVELAANLTRWVARHAPRLDYVVIAGASPAAILSAYSRLTGLPPAPPEWVTGFWQSKLRYASQAEVLEVAREYRRRGLPLSAIVIDYFHWSRMGDWSFDPAAWPDPSAMVRELRALQIEPVVSVWPTVNFESAACETLRDHGLLVARRDGGHAVSSMVDTPCERPVPLALYDATHPEGREHLWRQAAANYRAHGIRAFWLDACEPELSPFAHELLRYHAGRGDEVGCAYPRFHQRTFHDGLRAAGDDVVLLCRSAWAGSQALGAIVWSGDIASTFESLAAQVRAGLNMALSGIPWWNTDIGGFHGGDPADPAFRELLVRWFQYAVFTPVLRLHGVREPATFKMGAPNELWSFGPEVETRLAACLHLRERLRPYLAAQAALAARDGTPIIRPLFFDFPEDSATWIREDEFMFGPDILVAPITRFGQAHREVYLPRGADWFDAFTGQAHPSGVTVRIPASLERIPVFCRDLALLPLFRS